LESLNKLSDKEKTYIAQLPIKVTLDTPGYPEMKTMMGDHAEGTKVMNFICTGYKRCYNGRIYLKNFRPERPLSITTETTTAKNLAESTGISNRRILI
jgi:hypothetical protein